jgi:hypothetical protein
MSIIELDALPEAKKERAQQLGILRFIVGPEKTHAVRESPMWGTRLVETVNPLGTELDAATISGLRLVDPYPRIPAHLWQRWVKLCFHFADPHRPDTKGIDSISEVSCRFSRSMTDPTQWACWIPKQEVGGAHVNASMSELANIETGEVIKTWPPEGHFDAGSSHSHNSMAAFFSQTDDNSELSSPGFHCVLGKIRRDKMKYELSASIVLDKKRYIIEPAALIIDLTPVRDVTFHPSVMDMIDKKVYAAAKAEYTPPTTSYVAPKTSYSESWRERESREAREFKGRKGGIPLLSDNDKIRKGQLQAVGGRLKAILDRMVPDKDGLALLSDILGEYGLELHPISQK